MALFHHAMVDLRAWELLSSLERTGLLLVVRAATPTFIIVFGMMLEIVYVRRLERHGFAPVARRLLVRSAQCYAGYVATIVAGLIAGHLSLRGATAAGLFLQDAYFGNILKFYTLALLFAVPLLWLRQRGGMTGLLAVGAGLWLFQPLLASIIDPPSGLAHGMSFLMGIGDFTGPSVWHGLTFVVLGMLLGRALRHDWPAHMHRFYGVATGVMIAAGIVVFFFVLQSSPGDVLWNYVDTRAYRSANHPGYYAIGSLSAVAMLLALSWLIPRDGKAALVPPLLVLGNSSLLAFTLGNVILNLRPHLWAPVSAIEAMAAALSLLLLVGLMLQARTYAAIRWNLTRLRVGVARDGV